MRNSDYVESDRQIDSLWFWQRLLLLVIFDLFI